MPEQQVNLLYPSHRNPSSIVRAYLDFCQKHGLGDGNWRADPQRTLPPSRRNSATARRPR
jgi:hypothetical protein